MVELILFILLAGAVIAGALGVVIARNPVYAAMGMMATLFALAVFYVVQLAHFVAVVQVIVYAGAVMTLFLFVIMFIGVDKAETLRERLPIQRPAALTILVAVVVLAGFLVATDRWEWVSDRQVVASGGRQGQLLEPAPAPNGTIESIGDSLINEWLLPFEATSALLIIAAVGAIALAFYRPRRRSAPSGDPE